MYNVNLIREEWWATPVWYSDISSEIVDIEKLKIECQEYKDRYPSVSHSNIGGYQSPFVKDLEFENINKLKNVIDESCCAGLEDLGIIDDIPRKLAGLWININYQGSYNLQHIHPGSVLSGVFYVQIPKDSGNIVFEPSSERDFILKTITKQNNKFNWGTIEYTPLPGKLLIFPSWIQHQVSPSLSPEERISIAFNYGPIV